MSKMRIRVQQMECGWCDVDLHLDDKLMSFSASILGPNPIASLIEASVNLKHVILTREYIKTEVVWFTEPQGKLQICISTSSNSMLHIDVFNRNEDDEESIIEEWHGEVDLVDFLQMIMTEGFRVLRAFGLHGYHSAWSENEDFPFMQLLELASDKAWNEGKPFSTWDDEMCALSNLSDKMLVKEKKHFEECAIFYESWQIQCCGDPFSVGDKVEWTGVTPYEYPVADGVIIDFVENHHDAAFLSIKGTVERIVAHRSEFSRGKRETNYYKAVIISEELQTADGHESEIPDDDTTERTFWGYVVTLKDVVVEPLAK